MSSGGLYLFLGPDRPAKFQRLGELERTLTIHPFDRHHLDATTIPASELLAVCRQRPAASLLRLVVVDQAHRLDQPAVDALLQQAGAIRETACVALLVEHELSLRHPLASASSACAPGKTNQATSISVERFPGRGESSPKAFALTDALGARDAGGAFVAVRDQLGQGKEPLELLGLVAWQVNRWVIVKRLSEAGYRADRIAAVTGLRPWQVERSQAEVALRPLALLQGLLARCWELDGQLKSGRAVPELAIEQLVAEICLEEKGRLTSRR